MRINAWWVVGIVTSAVTFYEVFYMNGGFVPGWMYLGMLAACVGLLVKYPHIHIDRRKS